MTTTLNTPRKSRMITNVTQYDEFDLGRLLANVFVPIEGSKVAFLIDLDDPTRITDFAFLQDPAWPIQHRAHEHFYQAFHAGVGERLGLSGGDLYAYKTTGGSNLDLPDQAFTPEGNEVSLEADVYPHYDLILAITSSPAPRSCSSVVMATCHPLPNSSRR